MFIPKKAPLLASVLFHGLTALSQAPATPPPSSTGTFPLAGVHAGLHGTAYTVFQGSTPEAFGVDILGVLRNAQGPGEDLILARLTGAKVEYTGVVAGMSGSPVYIDGKLVGALAFRIGEFAKEPIAGITPIAQMLATLVAVRDLDGSSLGSAPAAISQAGDQTGSRIEPIDTPLVFSGFSPSSLALWREHAPRFGAGMEPQAGLGGSGAQTTAGPAKSQDSAPALEPGSAVSALLVAGDMEIAATCTVTYLDSGHLLACGHPLTQFGAVSLPMTKADVVTTLASPAGSFKIVNTGAIAGAFTQDRQTAIGGMIGATAHMIPVEIGIHGAKKPGTNNSGASASRSIHLRVLDQAQLTPTALLVSLFQALQETPRYAEEDSYHVHATVRLAGYPAVEINTLAAPGGLGAATLAAALNVGLRFNALYSSSDRQTTVDSVSIDVDVLEGRRAATLNRVAVEQSVVHAGDHITLAVNVAPYRGAPQTLRIPVTLPVSLPPGDVRLLVSDGATLDRLLTAGRTGSTPLSGTVAQLNAMHADDQLYVSLLAPEAELDVDGRVLGSLPLSVANLLLPSHERDKASLHSESAQTLASVPLEASFTGEQILSLRVE